MNKLVVLLFLSALVACSVTDSESESYSKWNYSGYVLDASNGLGLDGATIIYQDAKGNSDTVTTDEDGSFYVDDLPYGSLTFSFSYTAIDGKDTTKYAPKVITAGSTNESSSMQGIVASVSNVVRLCPLNATITGEFYIRDPISGTPIPVAKVPVQVTHKDSAFINLESDSYSSKTDSLGRFKFTNLPADSGLLLSIAPFTYKGLRYILSSTILPKLPAAQTKDIGRAYLLQDTLIVAKPRIKASNVMDSDMNGYKDISPLTTPYFVFNEELSDKSLGVKMSGDSAFILTPTVNKDTLFLKHDRPLPPSTEYSTTIVAYTKKNSERIELELKDKSAFSTGRGLYAVTSNAWPQNENYKSVFSIEDTLWVKFSEKLSSNVERVQWHFIAKASRTISCNGKAATADAWINKDTLFVQMREKILDTRSSGDSVGMDVTVYAENGLYIEHLLIMTELEVPQSSSSEADTTASSSSEEAPESSEDGASSSSSEPNSSSAESAPSSSASVPTSSSSSAPASSSSNSPASSSSKETSSSSAST